MRFNRHEQLEGKHAFLGASKSSWFGWTDEITKNRFLSQYAATIGTLVHELVKDLIDARLRIDMSDKKIIDLHLHKNYVPPSAYDSNVLMQSVVPFVNDAIGWKMKAEVVLAYSIHAFGTADAILYDAEKKELRIHDLKTGVTKVNFVQLIIYAALFFLEYPQYKPEDTTIILRIYQNGEILEHIPEYIEVEKYMFRMKEQSALVHGIYEGEFGDE